MHTCEHLINFGEPDRKELWFCVLFLAQKLEPEPWSGFWGPGSFLGSNYQSEGSCVSDIMCSLFHLCLTSLFADLSHFLLACSIYDAFFFNKVVWHKSPVYSRPSSPTYIIILCASYLYCFILHIFARCLMEVWHSHLTTHKYCITTFWTSFLKKNQLDLFIAIHTLIWGICEHVYFSSITNMYKSVFLLGVIVFLCLFLIIQFFLRHWTFNLYNCMFSTNIGL